MACRGKCEFQFVKIVKEYVVEFDTVPPGTSRTSQPSGAGAVPGSTPAIRTRSSKTSAPPGIACSPSNAAPARMPNIDPPDPSLTPALPSSALPARPPTAAEDQPEC